ncbi:hypothetical protein BGX26_010371 [Mortierella sp. AD094]|nr:hypothetical protein BGX26_010371 [Mortierella sp. AD094]
MELSWMKNIVGWNGCPTYKLSLCRQNAGCHYMGIHDTEAEKALSHKDTGRNADDVPEDLNSRDSSNDTSDDDSGEGESNGCDSGIISSSGDKGGEDINDERQFNVVMKRPKEADDDRTLLKAMCRGIPFDLAQSNLRYIGYTACKIFRDGSLGKYGIFVPTESFSGLKDTSPPGVCLAKLDMPTDQEKPDFTFDLHQIFNDLTDDGVSTLCKGGTIVMERLVRAFLETGSHRLRILCVEVYSRDKSSHDPA